MDTSGRVLLNSLVHPRLPITRAAGKVHNITEEMVAAAPTFPELVDDILRVTAGRRVLAYNAAFDMQCLLADAQRHRRNAEHLEDLNTWGCVMRARSAWVGTPDHFYRLEAGHRALGDARAALNVLQTIAADSRLYPWPVSGLTCGSRSNDTAVGDIANAIGRSGAVSVT